MTFHSDDVISLNGRFSIRFSILFFRIDFPFEKKKAIYSPQKKNAFESFKTVKRLDSFERVRGEKKKTAIIEARKPKHPS